MAYQTALDSPRAARLSKANRLDRVILAGGMARSGPLVEAISRGVAALGCGITVYPGENEMNALVAGALRVLNGRERARRYLAEEGR